MEPSILVYSRRPEEFVEWLKQHGCPGTIASASDPEGAERVIGAIDALLCWRFPPDLFASASRLRWVQSLGAGVEDLLAAPQLRSDVMVTRIVGQFGGSIAEYVFAELLARVRDLDRTRAQQRERRWERFEAGTLAGMLMGVAGLGSIGAEIVRKARAFDMHVHGLSRTPRHAALVDRHFGPRDWIDFARELDVLVLTLPLTGETEAVVDSRVLEALPSRATLINVGRGRLVREADLIEALQRGTIAGAILDVFETEPLPPESPLWILPGVTVTPHVSGPSTVEGVGQFFLENLRRYLQGEPLMGIVDREQGY